ncbi:hypothetical protein AVEN_126914-1 [Araneus ventricosus]|uniref:Uncharacterized protein n=1 Tax=Araneus ventricosus TaxID=182803 RepID=A0A4Y2C2P5_ARAVE|nr:hypothetical protein AVEN_126914-1 [Araneus ventricosus]
MQHFILHRAINSIETAPCILHDSFFSKVHRSYTEWAALSIPSSHAGYARRSNCTSELSGLIPKFEEGVLEFVQHIFRSRKVVNMHVRSYSAYLPSLLF